MIQDIDELEDWHSEDDPWEYEVSEDDLKRKEFLLKHLQGNKYENVLDIGCGQGYITKDLPGEHILGVDISVNAIRKAKRHETRDMKFIEGSLFNLNNIITKKFDLIIITGILYPQYIGNSNNLIYIIIDKLLEEGGTLISVHIDKWYKSKFPYLQYEQKEYSYREYTHKFECYIK